MANPNACERALAPDQLPENADFSVPPKSAERRSRDDARSERHSRSPAGFSAEFRERVEWPRVPRLSNFSAFAIATQSSLPYARRDGERAAVRLDLIMDSTTRVSESGFPARRSIFRGVSRFRARQKARIFQGGVSRGRACRRV
jgi:hypothetical protein